MSDVQYFADRAQAEREGTSVCAVEGERNLLKRADELNAPGLVQARAAKELAEKQLQEASELEQAHLRKVAQWDYQIRKYKDAQTVLERGRYQFSQLQQYLANLEAHLNDGQESWGADELRASTVTRTPLGMTNLFTRLAGCKAALADFPRWEALQKAGIENHEKGLVEFAKENGIEDHLPDYLRK